MANNLAAVTGIQVSPYLLSQPTPPAAMIFADEIEYDLAFNGGAHGVGFVVRVIVPFTTDIGSQTSLDGFRGGTGSVKEALEADSDLGGACDDLRVVSVGPDTIYADGVGCDFRVFVLAHD